MNAIILKTTLVAEVFLVGSLIVTLLLPRFRICHRPKGCHGSTPTRGDLRQLLTLLSCLLESLTGIVSSLVTGCVFQQVLQSFLLALCQSCGPYGLQVSMLARDWEVNSFSKVPIGSQGILNMWLIFLCSQGLPFYLTRSSHCLFVFLEWSGSFQRHLPKSSGFGRDFGQIVISI